MLVRYPGRMAIVLPLARATCRGALCTVLAHPANDYRPYLLRHPVLAFANAIILVATLGPVLALSLTPELARLSTITASTLAQLTNAERSKAGLPTLRENPSLSRSARLKAEHMLANDYFEHTSPDGLTPWAWFDRAGYRYLFAGENLAIDFTDAEDVVAAWLKSAGHRRNLLSDRYDEFGLAAVTGEFQGRQATMVVHHFGSRETAPTPPRGSVVARAATSAGTGPPPPTRPTATPTPPLSPPNILEPRAGAILTGASTVRGTAPAGSTVDLTLDAAPAGSYPAPAGSFVGTLTPPENTERPARLTAVARQDGRRSVPSRPIPVHLDTRGPALPAEVLLLPDPRGLPGRWQLVVPAAADIVALTAEIPGRGALSLRRTGDVFVGALPLAADTAALRGTDPHGNIRVTKIHAPLSYATRANTGAPRARVAAAVSRLRPPLAGGLAVLAALLSLNILGHLRRHRLLHGDLFAHASFVLVLGTTLVLFI